jgi:hypothetical protein
MRELWTDPSAVADDYSCTQRRRASERPSIARRCAEPHIRRYRINITFIDATRGQRVRC